MSPQTNQTAVQQDQEIRYTSYNSNKDFIIDELELFKPNNVQAAKSYAAKISVI